MDTKSTATMTAPRSRKRFAKMRRAATATIGCCCLAAAGVVSGDAAAKTAIHVPSHRVTPRRNNSPERRRLEREYYRQLASSQRRPSVQGFGEAVDDGAVASGSARLGDDYGDGDDRPVRRMLPGNEAMGVHKKGREYNNQAPGVHQKGNTDAEEEIEFVLMGGGGDPDPAPAVETPPQTQNKENDESEGQDPEPDLTLATNLLRFTRIGGVGYALPPSKRYPYMASLQLEGHSPSSGKYDVHMCGGVLVAPDMVMTAAHCAEYSPPGTDETYRAFNGIEVGKVDLSDEGAAFDPYDSNTYKLYYENLVPEKLHLHPRFDKETYENDVMLVKVFGMSRFPPVRIAEGDVSDGEKVTMLGWGAETASSGKKYSDQLKTAEMEIVGKGRCRGINVEVTDPSTEQTSAISLDDHIYDDMVCASSSQRYICYGDAGGPAVRKGGNEDEDEAVGIISWGYGCVNRDYPAVMAHVPSHYNWIRDTVCRESSDPPEQYGCPKSITAMSGAPTQIVTLKLKLDMMAVETGFLIERQGTREIMAQRQTGYYKSEMFGNEIVLETFELPRDHCFRLILLDSFGDGMCCDMGGGSATMYWGTDAGYYTGVKLAEVKGNFEFDSGADFCTSPPTGAIQSMSNHQKVPPPTPQYIAPYNPPPSPPPPPMPPKTPKPTGKSTPRPTHPPMQPIPGASWSGPVNSPEFEYCNQFCSTISHGMLCGNHECVHLSDVVTSDSNQPEKEETENEEGKQPEIDNKKPSKEEEGPLASAEFYYDGEYFLTVQFLFDDNPEEVSWVLYDLTKNEVKVFVDFDEYSKEDYAGALLNIIVEMDGPDEGERQYAFTVYDKESNGLCCKHGEGYYKVFLGDEEDDLELLGDDEFEFSSSYYFTVFEDVDGAEMADTSSPTASPTSKPTRAPTKKPTVNPTANPTAQPTSPPSEFPTKHPTSPPTTPKPTQPWELRRPENADEIGARWNIRSNTPPGVFNDVGGDQGRYRFNVDGTVSNAATSRQGTLSRIVFGMGVTLAFSIVLMLMH